MTQLAADETALLELEEHRGELTGYCYRMLGSTFDADDAVQETLVKAWQALDGFEGRSTMRSWLYRIATNVCLDALRSKQRRALPMDLSEPYPGTTHLHDPLPEATWLQPVPDSALAGDPAATVERQDSVRLAFVAALQQLPSRQRAVLVLREVLCWSAAEVAELLDTTVASVNSALQRARATLGAYQARAELPEATAEVDQELLRRYVAAFESYDVDGLVSLLHEDASISMPPLPMWFKGHAAMRTWYLSEPASGCRGSRMVPMRCNGAPAFAQYRPGADGSFVPWSIQVLELSGGGIAHVHHFLDNEMFPTGIFARFGLPERLEP